MHTHTRMQVVCAEWTVLEWTQDTNPIYWFCCEHFIFFGCAFHLFCLNGFYRKQNTKRWKRLSVHNYDSVVTVLHMYTHTHTRARTFWLSYLNTWRIDQMKKYPAKYLHTLTHIGWRKERERERHACILAHKQTHSHTRTQTQTFWANSLIPSLYSHFVTRVWFCFSGLIQFGYCFRLLLLCFTHWACCALAETIHTKTECPFPLETK